MARRRGKKSIRRARRKARRSAPQPTTTPRRKRRRLFGVLPVATPQGLPPMARRKSRRRRAFGAAIRRTTRRARHRFGSAAGSLSLRAALTAGAGATVGFVATDMLIDKVPMLNNTTGWGRIVAKAALAYFGGKMLARYSPTLGRSLIAGGLVRAGVDAYNVIRAQQTAGTLPAAARGVAGLGNLYIDENGQVMGLGSYESETDYAAIS